MISYLRYDARRALRNRRLVIFSVLMPTVLFLVNAGIDRGRIEGADTAAYLMVSMAVFGTLSASIGTGGLIATERGLGWNRTLRLTPLSPRAYAGGKVVLALLLAVPPMVTVYVLGATVEHVHLSAGDWLLTALLTWVGALPFAALGLFVGFVARPDSVQQISGLLYLLLSLLGGLWIPVELMPSALRAVTAWTPVYWSGRLARSPIFPGQDLDWRVVAVVAGWTVALALLGLWRYRADAARD